MCFSPEGDLVSGLIIVGLGIDACLHVKSRPAYLALAALPVALGLHQIDEAFVWFALQGTVSNSVGHVAMWIYLTFAFVILPVAVPMIVIAITPTTIRRRRIIPLLVLGLGVSGVLLAAMMQRDPNAAIGSYHISYSIGLQHGLVVVALYIVATCGPLLMSGIRFAVWLGVANLVAVVVLARLSADGFTSLWCFYAAIASGIIAAYLRVTQTHLQQSATT